MSSQVGKTASRSTTVAKMAKFMVKLALIAVVFVLGCSSSDPGKPGGVGGEILVTPKDTEINELFATVKSEVYKALSLSANAALTLKSYSKQVVAGTNYFIKVDIGGGHCKVIKVFKPLPYTGKPASLASDPIKPLTSCTDKISYF